MKPDVDNLATALETTRGLLHRLTLKTILTLVHKRLKIRKEGREGTPDVSLNSPYNNLCNHHSFGKCCYCCLLSSPIVSHYSAVAADMGSVIVIKGCLQYKPTHASASMRNGGTRCTLYRPYRLSAHRRLCRAAGIASEGLSSCSIFMPIFSVIDISSL